MKWRPGSKHPLRSSLLLAGLTMVAASCVVEEPDVVPLTIDAANGEVFDVPTPVFLPTPVPEPTATPAPPTPTPPPTPEPTPPPPLATPLPVAEPAPEVERIGPLQGTLVVPIAGRTTFTLTEPHELVQLPGHTLIYLPDGADAEVDIFTPVASGAGATLNDVGDVLIELTSAPLFDGLTELAPVSVAGHPTLVFEGVLVEGERGFYTDASTITNESAGWYPPTQIRMWLIDTPQGVVAVTAEALEGSASYSDAIRLATEVLATITFAP